MVDSKENAIPAALLHSFIISEDQLSALKLNYTIQIELQTS